MHAAVKGTIRLGLRASGLYGRGMKNAAELRLNDVALAFPALPGAFDGYRILHLSDLHIGLHPETAGRVAALCAGTEADLCVMTGDYRPTRRSDPDAVLPAMERIAGAIAAPDGILAVLGNHDDKSFAATLPPFGIEVLANRAVVLQRGEARLSVLGVQDHLYRVIPAGRTAFAGAPAGFVVALVHSPRYASVAARAGIDLYLCGHTHGGQICLPGGFPLFVPRGGRGRAAGGWRMGTMVGYTSRGAGTSGLPVRFNCRPELVRYTLRRDERTT